ncbi:hypothetical protein [Arthrobacter sp. zg-Y1116]|uniref:hypothetical protein n=1 Tax=Arthrobacter sp. zg-Y1116 TaxID=2964611 RepID=UPI002105DFA9|nr:hypothetical protein [Arthrobacter sp. zg-Y1116]MCQ1947877.1 hypothetical protein [Arthrobacter sp. zg-Y1116]
MEAERDYLANEYRAQQARERRDYRKAIEYTELARDSALQAGDNWGYCRLMLDIIRYQYDLGLVDDCIQTIETLIAHPAILEYPESGVRARVLYAQVLQDKGASERALRAAQEAVSIVPDRSRELRTAAQHSRVSTMAEEGEVEAAWQEAMVLDSLVGPEAGARASGMAYWTIGNSAFMSGRIEEGLRFHRQAATALTSLGDVNLWALFNKASANLRMDAGVVGPETLECIERAEVAISVSEGNLADRLEILLSRAHWEHLAGNNGVAEQKLRDVAIKAEELFPYTRAQALMVLARCLFDLGRAGEALDAAREGERLFDGIGAPVQAERAREIIRTILRNDSIAQTAEHETKSQA